MVLPQGANGGEVYRWRDPGLKGKGAGRLVGSTFQHHMGCMHCTCARRWSIYCSLHTKCRTDRQGTRTCAATVPTYFFFTGARRPSPSYSTGYFLSPPALITPHLPA